MMRLRFCHDPRVIANRHYAEKHLETADTDKRAKLMTILKEYEGQ